MTRALTKFNKFGILYTRPSAIENSIVQASNQSPDTLLLRARIRDPKDLLYFPSEVLVHLIRIAFRASDWKTGTALLAHLQIRCARQLRRRVQPNSTFDAFEVHEAVIERLYELFAKDLQDPSAATLDYYEVRFNRAFAKLCADVIREEIRHRASLEPLPSIEISPDSDSYEATVCFSDLDPVVQAENAELYRMIQALPPNQRDAVIWKYFYGHKTESHDPEEVTVASLSGVSGREIRARLRAARDNLLQWIKKQTQSISDTHATRDSNELYDLPLRYDSLTLSRLADSAPAYQILTGNFYRTLLLPLLASDITIIPPLSDSVSPGVIVLEKHYCNSNSMATRDSHAPEIPCHHIPRETNCKPCSLCGAGPTSEALLAPPVFLHIGYSTLKEQPRGSRRRNDRHTASFRSDSRPTL